VQAGQRKAGGLSHGTSGHPGQFQWLQGNPPPWSYANAAHFGLHTFHFATAAGERAVRWRLQPRDGIRGLTDAELASALADFLAA